MGAQRVLLFIATCIALAASADGAPEGFKFESVVLYQPDAPYRLQAASVDFTPSAADRASAQR